MDPYPRPRQVLRVVLLAMLLAQFLVWPLIGPYAPRAGLVAAELALVWTLALFIRRRRLVSEDLLLLNATPVATLIFAAIGAAGASLLVAEFDLLCAQTAEKIGLSPPLLLYRNLLEIQVIRTLSELPSGLVSVVLVPASCEEIFFRGFVFTGLYASYGSWPAISGSAFLFAFVHLDPWHFPALFLFGIFLGLLVYWTHSLYPAVLAHLINNLFSFAGVNLRAHWGWGELAAFQHLPPLAICSALLVLLFALWQIRRRPAIMPLLSGTSSSPPRLPCLS